MGPGRAAEPHVTSGLGAGCGQRPVVRIDRAGLPRGGQGGRVALRALVRLAWAEAVRAVVVADVEHAADTEDRDPVLGVLGQVQGPDVHALPAGRPLVAD